MTRLSLAAFALLALEACTCGPPKVNSIDVCRGVAMGQVGKDQPCADGSECADHYACQNVKDVGAQCCVLADRRCTTEADCCPGQTCPADRKKCFDKFLSCDTDADCGDKGDRFCEPYTDIYGTSNRCRFKTCGALGECPAGQSCFQNECMAELPCQGACQPGEACVPTIDRCQKYSPVAAPREMAACPVSCNTGFIGAFKDPRNIWDACVLPDVQCICAELPGLRSNDLGRYSAIAALPGKGLVASLYDGQYGDLVVARYGLDGKRIGLDYLDGVPADAMARYGPSGARKGIVEPGPDVGRYTDVVVGKGESVLVSYYDVTNGDLKVAVREGETAWSTHTVDGMTGDVGLYSSIAVDSEGLPGIAYFQRGAEASFDIAQCPTPAPTGAKAYVTALKLARATTATPKSASDWKVQVLACASRPAPACLSCSGATQCADPGTGPDCFPTATSCTGCDANTEVCVTSGTAAVCAKRYNPSNLAEVVDGVGVFASLAFKDKEAIIAYMKRTTPPPMGATRFKPDGDLWAVRVPATGTVPAAVRLDEVGDTGYFPDVKIDPATKAVAISWHDFTSRALKFYTAASVQAGVTPEIIDSGAGMSGDSSFVGTDSALVYGDGKLFAVYQDSTKGDLKVARRGTGWQVVATPSSMGAVGFFADGVFESGQLYASHARFNARLVAGEPHVDNSLLLERLASP